MKLKAVITLTAVSLAVVACQKNNAKTNPLIGNWASDICNTEKANDVSNKLIAEIAQDKIVYGSLVFSNKNCTGRPTEAILDQSVSASVDDKTINITEADASVKIPYTRVDQNTIDLLLSQLQDNTKNETYRRMKSSYLNPNLSGSSATQLPVFELVGVPPRAPDTMAASKKLFNASNLQEMKEAFKILGLEFQLETVNGNGDGSPSLFGSYGNGPGGNQDDTSHLEKEQEMLKKLSEAFADTEVLQLMQEKKVANVLVSNPYLQRNKKNKGPKVRMSQDIEYDEMESYGFYIEKTFLSVDLNATKEDLLNALRNFQLKEEGEEYKQW